MHPLSVPKKDLAKLLAVSVSVILAATQNALVLAGDAPDGELVFTDEAEFGQSMNVPLTPLRGAAALLLPLAMVGLTYLHDNKIGMNTPEAKKVYGVIVLFLAAVAGLDGAFTQPIAAYFTALNIVLPVSTVGLIASYSQYFRILKKVDLTKEPLPAPTTVEEAVANISKFITIFNDPANRHTANYVEAAAQADDMIKAVTDSLQDFASLQSLSATLSKIGEFKDLIKKNTDPNVAAAVKKFEEFIKNGDQVLKFSAAFKVDIAKLESITAALEAIKTALEALIAAASDATPEVPAFLKETEAAVVAVLEHIKGADDTDKDLSAEILAKVEELLAIEDLPDGDIKTTLEELQSHFTVEEEAPKKKAKSNLDFGKTADPKKVTQVLSSAGKINTEEDKEPLSSLITGFEAHLTAIAKAAADASPALTTLSQELAKYNLKGVAKLVALHKHFKLGVDAYVKLLANEAALDACLDLAELSAAFDYLEGRRKALSAGAALTKVHALGVKIATAFNDSYATKFNNAAPANKSALATECATAISYLKSYNANLESVYKSGGKAEPLFQPTLKKLEAAKKVLSGNSIEVEAINKFVLADDKMEDFAGKYKSGDASIENAMQKKLVGYFFTKLENITGDTIGEVVDQLNTLKATFAGKQKLVDIVTLLHEFAENCAAILTPEDDVIIYKTILDSFVKMQKSVVALAVETLPETVGFFATKVLQHATALANSIDSEKSLALLGEAQLKDALPILNEALGITEDADVALLEPVLEILVGNLEKDQLQTQLDALATATATVRDTANITAEAILEQIEIVEKALKYVTIAQIQVEVNSFYDQVQAKVDALADAANSEELRTALYKLRDHCLADENPLKTTAETQCEVAFTKIDELAYNSFEAKQDDTIATFFGKLKKLDDSVPKTESIKGKKASARDDSFWTALLGTGAGKYDLKTKFSAVNDVDDLNNLHKAFPELTNMVNVKAALAEIKKAVKVKLDTARYAEFGMVTDYASVKVFLEKLAELDALLNKAQPGNGKEDAAIVQKLNSITIANGAKNGLMANIEPITDLDVLAEIQTALAADKFTKMVNVKTALATVKENVDKHVIKCKIEAQTETIKQAFPATGNFSNDAKKVEDAVKVVTGLKGDASFGAAEAELEAFFAMVVNRLEDLGKNNAIVDYENADEGSFDCVRAILRIEAISASCKAIKSDKWDAAINGKVLVENRDDVVKGAITAYLKYYVNSQTTVQKKLERLKDAYDYFTSEEADLVNLQGDDLAHLKAEAKKVFDDIDALLKDKADVEDSDYEAAVAIINFVTENVANIPDIEATNAIVYKENVYEPAMLKVPSDTSATLDIVAALVSPKKLTLPVKGAADTFFAAAIKASVIAKIAAIAKDENRVGNLNAIQLGTVEDEILPEIHTVIENMTELIQAHKDMIPLEAAYKEAEDALQEADQNVKAVTEPVGDAETIENEIAALNAQIKAAREDDPDADNSVLETQVQQKEQLLAEIDAYAALVKTRDEKLNAWQEASAACDKKQKEIDALLA